MGFSDPSGSKDQKKKSLSVSVNSDKSSEEGSGGETEKRND